MGSHAKEMDKRNIYKNWWFWVIILVIIIIVSITSIIIVAINKVKSGVSGVASEIQREYKDATLYSSAGENTLILELRHLKENSDISKIFKPIKDNIKTELSTYSKLIIIGYIDIDNKENAQIVQMVYNLPMLKEQSTQIYIDEEYLQTSINNSIIDMVNEF